MEKIVTIIRKKPIVFLVVSLGYLLLVGFLKWRLSPPIEGAFYLAGGILGIYFLDGAEVFFRLTPSPFRSIVFAAGLGVVSFFVITSTDSLLGKGLVLSLSLTILLWQYGEWHVRSNLASWYQMITGPVSTRTHVGMLLGLILLFFIETYLFVG